MKKTRDSKPKTRSGANRRSAAKPSVQPARTPAGGTDQDGAGASKLDRLGAMLRAPGGASIAEMIAATGWQQHSVRGAMAGALKKRGLIIGSRKLDGIRRYRAEGR